MLDNERLIYKMLLEQKLRLVTSANLYKSSPVGAYEFPVVRFGEKPFEGNENAVLTQFPSDRTLASSWNTELVEKVFAAEGDEARKHDAFDGYFSCNDPRANPISSSHFLSAQYLSAKHRGAAGKQPTAHRVARASFAEEQLRKNFTDTMLEEGAPDILIAENVEDAEFYLKNREFHGLVYGVASSPEEAARYFFVGCAFVYLREDFFNELFAYFDQRIKNYRVAYGEYKENRLSLKELDRRARIQDIFDEGILDNACDRVINYLKQRKKAEIKAPAEKSAADGEKEKKEREEHARLARKAARESFVLLKNQNNLLPLKQGTKVALIGEYLENPDFQSENFACQSTQTRLPIEIAKDFESLSVAGYAAGYRKDEKTDEELVSNAARLASAADVAIVFLSAEPKARELPENQALLVKALVGWNIKVVAVISADCPVNTAFARGCQALLYTGRGGQEAVGAAFDLITGVYSPCGKLTESVSGVGGYPFGYGLTYTTFSYRDLEIDESGVTVIVENTGSYGASAIVQLYLQKNGSAYEKKTLKGFQKVFIKKGDTVRVTIPFTENTFRYYDGNKKKYRTQGGEYNLFISESETADKLTGAVKIAADDGSQFTNTLSETSADGNKIAFSESRGLKERKGPSFGMKLFLMLSLFVYYNAIMGMLLFADFIPVERTTLFYALVGAITGVIDFLIIFYIVFISVKKKKQYVPVNDTLTDLVDQVDEFVEIAKLTYPDPVKEKEKAVKAQKEEEERKAAEEKKEKEREEREKREEEQAKADGKKKEEEKKEESSKKPASKPSLDKPGDYPESDSFEKTYTSFRRYLMERGINIGAASARRLLAAVVSTRLVLVTSKNQELLPEFLVALNNYFGGMGVSVAEDNWNTIEDLLWKENAGRNSFSTFTNAVHDASRRHNKNAVALIGNVNSENLSDWFAEFIDFAASPSEEHVIALNDEAKLTISQNFCTLLFAKENGFDTELAREVLNASLLIDVSIRRAEGAEENGQAESTPSYPNLCALVREAREKYFLSEKNWGKIDALFEFINTNERLPFGNKNTLMSEKFTSVLMACGAEESEAITSLLRFKIIPLLKTSHLYAQEDGITILSDYLQKAFPDEDLAKVQKLLSERPKKIEEKVGTGFVTPDNKGMEEAKPEEEPAEPIILGGAYEEEKPAEPIILGGASEEEKPSEPIVSEGATEEPAEEPKEEERSSEPVYETTEDEVYTSEAESDEDEEGEVPTLESILGDETDESVPDEAPAYEESAAPSYETPAYDAGAYQNNSYADNGYGYQNYSDGYNSYGSDGYAGYSNGYENYRDGYQNNGYTDYGNYSADEWGRNDGGENK